MATKDERAVESHRQNVHSATYFLVWHGGMTIGAAESLLADNRRLIEPLADSGRIQFARCCNALSQWIDRLASTRASKGRSK